MTPDELRRKRLRSWEPYLGRIAGMMGLSHWTILRSDEPPGRTPNGDEVAASVEPIYGRYYAVLRLGDHFLDREPPQEQRDTVTHELIHLHLAAVQQMARENLSDEVFPQFLMALEYAVDGMAKAWAAQLPLPPQPKPKKGRSDG